MRDLTKSKGPTSRPISRDRIGHIGIGSIQPSLPGLANDSPSPQVIECTELSLLIKFSSTTCNAHYNLNRLALR